MYTATQFAIPLDGEPHTLAHVLSTLKRSGIDVGPMMLTVPPERSALRVVVDKPGTTGEALRRLGMDYGRTEVVCLDLDDPDGLGCAVDELAKAQIKVWYAYCAAGKNRAQTTWVLRVRDVQKAMTLLQQAHGATHGSPVGSA